MLWAGYTTPIHLDNSDKPDTNIVKFKHLESFHSLNTPYKVAKWTECTAKNWGIAQVLYGCHYSFLFLSHHEKCPWLPARALF